MKIRNVYQPGPSARELLASLQLSFVWIIKSRSFTHHEMSNYSVGPSFEYRTAGGFDKTVAWGYPSGVSIVDLVPEDMKALVHPHWNKFPPVNPMWHYLLVNISY